MQSSFPESISIDTSARAIFEASRCIECYDAFCIKGCPVEVDIPRFISRIKMGDFIGANQVIKEKCILPAVCGRVCPVEKLCVKNCVLTETLGPVEINHLQRFVAEYELEEGTSKFLHPQSNNKKVAIVGSGPAGLAVAAELAKKGYKVDVFESEECPGGMMTYGIPSYRLPRKIVLAEIDNIKQIGVNIHTNTRIKGNELLKKGYDAICISTGTAEPISIGILGEDLKGVFQGVEFLRQLSIAEGKKKDFPQIAGKNIAVIGGGDVAMDAAISAAQLGAKRTHIIYRRSFKEMPAVPSEVNLAKMQGILFWTTTNPIKIIGDSQGQVKAIELLEVKLGKPDKNGRQEPIPLEDTKFQLAVDIIVEAVGQASDYEIIKALKLDTDSNGIIKVNESGETSRSGIFAAGDIISGGATVIQSLKEGQKVAISIDKYLTET